MSPDFCPYVGLRPFTAAERAYFFGRERDQRIIASNLFASPLTVLYGPSAVGKSSVLQAGVVPQLSAEPRIAIVYFANWPDPTYIDSLRAECRRAVSAAHGASLDVDDTLPLDEWLAQASQVFRGTLLLILDQFEEYLLYHAENDEAAFDSELARLVNRREVPANVLLGIREDGLAKLDRFRKRIPNLLGNLLRLRRLSPEGARAAITGPIDVYNQQLTDGRVLTRLDPALIDAVIDQVRGEQIQQSVTGGTGTTKASGEGDLIETALLQMVMTHLWREALIADGTRVLKRAALERLGGSRNVVKLHLFERLNELTPDGRTIAAKVFQELVTPTGAKIAHTTDDLIAFAKEPAARVLPVLDSLSRSRLLRRIDPPERYEIFHDALASAILDWRAEYLQEIARKTALEEAEARRKVVAQRRNRRIAAAFLAVVVLGAVVFALYAVREAERLRLTAQVSEARAEKAEQLQYAARQAQITAENSKREAELTLQRGQIDLEAIKARLSNQPNRVDQLNARAAAVDNEIAQARQASAESSRQAQSALVAAEATQKRIDTLNAEIAEKGLAKPPERPDTPAVVTPAATTPAPAADPSPSSPGTVPAVTPPAVTPNPSSQGDYKALYRQAVNARDRKRWSDAAQLFQSAAAIRGDTGETISMPGFGDEQRYLPYYNLGFALQNLNDCAGALRAWDRAEQSGAVSKNRRDVESLNKARAQCGGTSR